ncbi:hypothetical protein KPL47_17920 [Clostridium estertheticum]|uniref:TnsD family Tn7-like transposition protein n=1 Tax=Clostridium estertheticum TaxID=238834 RepID=UPI001C0B6607|nr:TnsD family Tn7-like transposition protein [Clostridium estertheticum]MBU3178207.1 hypothetical protein [Clostridium estertheticum]
MNCDPKTILKFKFKFGINTFQNIKVYIKDKETVAEADKLIKYKSCILTNIGSNPVATRTEIIDICKKEYLFIYRNDKKWLYDNLPVKIKRIDHHAFVDWNKRDTELLIIVQNKHEELMGRSEPRRVTKSSIGVYRLTK